MIDSSTRQRQAKHSLQLENLKEANVIAKTGDCLCWYAIFIDYYEPRYFHDCLVAVHVTSDLTLRVVIMLCVSPYVVVIYVAI